VELRVKPRLGASDDSSVIAHVSPLRLVAEAHMTEPSLAAGSPQESARFAELQARLKPLFRDVYVDPRAPRTVVIVPGLSMDQDLLSRIEGLQHYEERQLTMLMLLRLPPSSVQSPGSATGQASTSTSHAAAR